MLSAYFGAEGGKKKGGRGCVCGGGEKGDHKESKKIFGMEA